MSRIWGHSQGPRVALVAGEPSGDRLGAGLMAALRARGHACTFAGVGGDAMRAEGLRPLAGLDQLAVNGLTDPLVRLPDLISILRRLQRALAEEPPHVFVGVDFNVFNLLLERRVRRSGVPVVHYVSPSVYAWRRGRVRRVSRSADMLLALFPFERDLYRGLPLEVVYVGHPLADAIDPDAGSAAARQACRGRLGVPLDGDCVAVLPGSRTSEVKHLGPVFLRAARHIAERRAAVTFVVPCVRPQISAWLDDHPELSEGLDLVTYAGDARVGLTACDAALVKSGTSTLEAMLLRRPMVVSYKLGALSYRVLRLLVRTPYVALPNILAGRALVPELLQDAAQPEALAKKVCELLDKSRGEPEYLRTFATLHAELRRGANERAAEAIAGRFLDP